MTVLGNIAHGANAFDMVAHHAYGLELADPLASDLFVGSVMVYLSGLGAGGGAQVMRPVVAEVGVGAAPAVHGEEVAIPHGQVAGWAHLPFAMPPRMRSGFLLFAGVHVGAVSGSARLQGIPGAGLEVAALYPDGALDIAAGVALGFEPSIAVCGLAPYAPPEVPDEDIARMPLDVAQAYLGAGGVASPGVRAVAGWHGRNVDEDVGSFAVVRTGGPLEDRVGERVRVSAAGRSIVAVVKHEQDFPDAPDEDISLTRRTFQWLAPLSTEALPVLVEVLG